MVDSKLKSLSEGIANVGIGFWINFGLNTIVFPFFGFFFNVLSYSEVGAFYTITSLFRQYVLRRLFAKRWTFQPRKGSLLEVGSGAIVNYFLNFFTGLLVLPLFGIHATIDISIISLISTIFTMIRQYVLRRIFNKFAPKENLGTLTIKLVIKLRKRFKYDNR